MKKLKIYLAGGLFNAGQRLHNLFLAKYLRELGHAVILPQVEALQFFHGDRFDVAGVVESCRQACQSSENIFVGSADGADADSGTCVEYGIAITSAGTAIIYRTDFRTAEEKEVGVNAMLKARGTIFIYHPCFIADLNQVEGYYRELARKIHEAVLSITK